jgi:hypothetical protein
LAATAARLINKHGRTVTLIHQGNTPLDTDKPWRAQATYPRAQVTGQAVFTEREIVNEETNTKRQGEVLLFAANATDEALEDFDAVEDGGRLWRLTNGRVIQPGPTRIMYEFEVDR